MILSLWGTHCDITYWFELVSSTRFEALSFGFRGVAMLVDFFFQPELCIFTSWSGGEERGAGFTEKPRSLWLGLHPLACHWKEYTFNSLPHWPHFQSSELCPCSIYRKCIINLLISWTL